MKMILACLSTLPLLSLSVSAESTSTPAAATAQSNKTVVKRGLSLGEVESVLRYNAMPLDWSAIPLPTLVLTNPKDPIEVSVRLPEGKGGYFLRFEWDETEQRQLLQEIWHSADIKALMELKNSKVFKEADKSFAPKKVSDIRVGSADVQQRSIKVYKRNLAENIEYAVVNLSIMRQAPNRGRIANEILNSVCYEYRDFGDFHDYEEYINEELDILKQLADNRYASEEELEALWQNALKSQQELQRKYPKSAKSIPSLIEYVNSTHQSQAKLTATLRAKNNATAREQREKELILLGLDVGVFFDDLPISVQHFVRHYLYNMLLAEAENFEKYEDLDDSSYHNVRSSVDILKKTDISALPEEYRKAVESHIEELERFLLSAKDDKLPLDADLRPDVQQIVQKNIDEATEWIKNALPSRSTDEQSIRKLSAADDFRDYLDFATLLRWVLESDDLLDYYYYLFKQTAKIPSKKDGRRRSRLAAINRIIAEKIKIH